MNKSIPEASVVFGESSYPVPIEQRPLWRLGLLCHSVKYLSDKNNEIRLDKARVSIWMLIRPLLWEKYYKHIISKNFNGIEISTDKSTEKTFNIGMSKNFITINGDKISLTTQGEKIIELSSELKIFSEEIEFLSTIKTKLTDGFVTRIVSK
jgi:hypothetical protein